VQEGTEPTFEEEIAILAERVHHQVRFWVWFLLAIPALHLFGEMAAENKVETKTGSTATTWSPD